MCGAPLPVVKAYFVLSNIVSVTAKILDQTSKALEGHFFDSGGFQSLTEASASSPGINWYKGYLLTHRQVLMFFEVRHDGSLQIHPSGEYL